MNSGKLNFTEFMERMKVGKLNVEFIFPVKFGFVKEVVFIMKA